MIFKSLGKNCKISDKISVFNGHVIEIGDNVRIDDFCILSGGSGLNIGSHIHIAAGCYFYAGSGIIIHDFVQIAPRCTFVSESDDFSGHSLVGPCVPMKFKPQYERGTIVLYRHVLMGAHCVVFPGVILNEGAAVGAGSVVTKDCYTWSIYAGVPAKYKKLRSTAMKDLERQFLEEYYGRRCA